MKKTCSSCKSSLDIGEFRVRKDSPDGRRGQCNYCFKKVSEIRRLRNLEKKKNYDILYRKENSDKLKKQMKDYQEKNKEGIKEVRKEYRNLNKEKIYLSNKLYRASNKEKIKKKKRKYSQKNKHIVNSISARRRASKIKATPSWSEKLKIDLVYEKCKAMSDLLGVEMVVDHVVPLNNSKVCGLHVWANLQILESKINTSKSNKIKIKDKYVR